MPRVPVYDSPQVEERAAPVPVSNVQPSQGGAELAQGLQQLGAGVGQLGAGYERAQAKANAARVQDAFSQLGQWKDDNIDNPDGGALTLKEGQATGMTPKYMGEFEQHAQALRGNLANDEQRRQFDELFVHQRDALYSTLSHHEAQQHEVLGDAAYKGGLSSAASSAANAYTVGPDGRPNFDDIAFLNGKAAGEKLIEGKAAADAWSPEQKDAELRNYRSALVFSTIDRAIENQDLGTAEKLLKSYGPDLDGLERAKKNIDQRLAQAGQAVEVDRTLQDIRRQATDPQTGWVDEQKALDAAYAIPSEKRWKKQLVSEVENTVAKSKQVAKGQAETQFNLALDVLAKTGSLTSPEMGPYRDWLNDPAHASAGAGDLWHKLVQQALENNQRERSTRAAERQTQAQIDKELKDEFQALPVREQAGVSIGEQFVGRGGSMDILAQMSGLQRRAKEQVQKGISPTMEQFDKALTDDVKTTKHLSDSQEKANSYRAAMHDWWSDFVQKNQRVPTGEEVKKARGDALLYGDNGYLGLAPNKFKFEVPADNTKFKPFDPEDQPYAPNSGTAPSIQAPSPAAAPAAPAKASSGEKPAPPTADRTQRFAKTASGVPVFIQQVIRQEYQQKRRAEPTEAQLVARYNLGIQRGDW